LVSCEFPSRLLPPYTVKEFEVAYLQNGEANNCFRDRAATYTAVATGTTGKETRARLGLEDLPRPDERAWNPPSVVPPDSAAFPPDGIVVTAVSFADSPWVALAARELQQRWPVLKIERASDPILRYDWQDALAQAYEQLPAALGRSGPAIFATYTSLRNWISTAVSRRWKSLKSSRPRKAYEKPRSYAEGLWTDSTDVDFARDSFGPGEVAADPLEEAIRQIIIKRAFLSSRPVIPDGAIKATKGFRSRVKPECQCSLCTAIRARLPREIRNSGTLDEKMQRLAGESDYQGDLIVDLMEAEQDVLDRYPEKEWRAADAWENVEGRLHRTTPDAEACFQQRWYRRKLDDMLRTSRRLRHQGERGVSYARFGREPGRMFVETQ
jgi:hypothetical protein